MEPYNHLPLVQENINFTRQGRQDKRAPRDVSPHVHGAKLKKNFSEKEEEFQSTQKVGEDFIFQIIRDTEKTINYRKIGLTWLADIGKTKSVVRVDDAVLFNQCLSDFTAEKINTTRVVNYSEFAVLDEFVFLTPEEKKGPLLEKETIVDDLEYVLDIQLYTGDDPFDQIRIKATEFREFLRESNIRILDDIILSNLVMFKLSLVGSLIPHLLEHKNVYYADLPQKSIYDFESFRNTGISELPEVLPVPGDAPMAAIIDSGILPTHPLLRGTVMDSAQFGGLEHPFDENGHGTMVAGIVQYGDVYKTLTESTTPLEPQVRLLNGRVTNRDNEFPDDRILAKVVREAIAHFIEEYDCQIFNVSLGDKRTPYQPNTKMDPWSYTLDDLNHKHNIAIVVSSGNYEPDNREEIINEYLDDLLSDPSAALIPPGLAVSTLTIGSRSHQEVPYNAMNRLTFVPVAKQGHISPFSRSGFGYNRSIKPETTAFGGNFSFHTLTKRINDKDRNLGIFSTSIFDNSTGSWFETRPGTSFAAPYITHLLTRIKKVFPAAKGNLLRALLINSITNNTIANDAIKEKYADKDIKPAELRQMQMRLSGYGDIREQFIDHSYDRYVTMFYEGEIGMDKVSVFEIPIPDEVYSSKGNTNIHVTLAYNPPCRDSRVDYTGVKMSFELYRGLSLEEIMKYTCKPDEDEFEKDKLPKEKEKNKCILSPSMLDVSRGTLLRATHTIASSSRSQQTYGNTYHLVVKCAKRWYEERDTQSYAVVVALEHDDEEIQLYSAVRNRVEQRIQPRRRIRG